MIIFADFTLLSFHITLPTPFNDTDGDHNYVYIEQKYRVVVLVVHVCGWLLLSSVVQACPLQYYYTCSVVSFNLSLYFLRLVFNSVSF